MVKERNINWFHWFIGFVCGFMVAVLTMNFAHASETEIEETKIKLDYTTPADLGKLSYLTCDYPDETWNVSSDRYLVFYSYSADKYYVWFMSSKATFRFVDGNSSKDLYCHDLYGRVWEIWPHFSNIIYDKDNGGNVVWLRPDALIPNQFNEDRSSIVFVYSTHDISVSFVEAENYKDTIYIPAGLNPDFEAYVLENNGVGVEEEEENKTILDYLKKILEAIKELPDLILDGLRDILSSIFIPSGENVEADIEDLKKSIFDNIGFDVEELETTLSTMDEEAIQDVYVDLEIAGKTQTVKVLDTRFLIVGVNYFRPIIRGFIYLMMFFFVLNQIAHIVHINGFNKGGDSE